MSDTAPANPDRVAAQQAASDFLKAELERRGRLLSADAVLANPLAALEACNTGRVSPAAVGGIS